MVRVHFIPFLLQWGPNMGISEAFIDQFLQSDVLAGLAVGVMAVPQCVSFALMAGLPSVYGLYSALLPVLAYALTGSSPQLVCKLTSHAYMIALFTRWASKEGSQLMTCVI